MRLLLAIKRLRAIEAAEMVGLSSASILKVRVFVFCVFSFFGVVQSPAQSSGSTPYVFVADNGKEYDYGMRRNIYPNCLYLTFRYLTYIHPCRTPFDKSDKVDFNTPEYKDFQLRSSLTRDTRVYRSIIKIQGDPEWFSFDRSNYKKLISAQFSDNPGNTTEGVCVKVWAINPTDDNEGFLVYGLTLRPNSQPNSWTETFTDDLPEREGIDAFFNGIGFVFKDLNDIRVNLTAAMFGWSEIPGAYRLFPDHLPMPLHSDNLQLAIEVYARGANNIKFTIPRLGEFDLDKINAEAVVASQPVTLKVNNQVQNTAGNIEIKLGDKVEFQINSVSQLSGSDLKFEKLPNVWIAHAAGETKYYCTSSITPGEFKPWIGFDSQVHGSFLAKYPPGYKPRERDWVHTIDNYGFHHYTFTWYAQRHMDATKTTYSPVVTWQEKKTVSGVNYPGGVTTDQRNSQRDGLNMEILRAWKEFQKQTGSRYLLGTDPDEYVYLGQQDPTPLTQKVLKGQYEGWKLPPGVGPSSEGENSDAIIDMVKAYKAFQENKSGINVNKNYEGYEIEDDGTYCKKVMDPSGTKKIADPLTPCDGGDCMYNSKGWASLPNAGKNNAAPGAVNVRIGSQSVSLKLNVISPLNSNSFYGVIEGTQWPARYEQHVPYTLSGLDNQDPYQLSRYILCLEHINSLGERTVQSHHLSDEVDLGSDAGQAMINGPGKWTTYFDFSDGGYYNVTAYIKTTDGQDSVIIGGKELRVIDLRFVSVAGSVNQGNYPPGKLPPGLDLKEGRGDGKYWYTVGFNKTSPFHIPFYGKTDDRYQKRYTFSMHDTVTFMSFDADPHTFENYTTEFYISKRLQAKGIPDDTLANAKGNYLTWWKYRINSKGYQNSEAVNTSDPVKIGVGRNCTYRWDDAGKFELRARYRTDTMKVMYSVNIVKYNYSKQNANWTTDATKGEISIRDLSPDEIRWLGLQQNTPYKVARIDNILSKYKYVDGPREPLDANRLRNKYEKFNDFNAQYKWEFLESNGEVDYTHPSDVSSWLSNEKNQIFTNWFPSNWVRHTPSNDTPPADIGTQYSTSIDDFSQTLAAEFNRAQEDWQIRMPWIAKTDFSGYLTRTNIKVIYDLNAFFDQNHGAFTGQGNYKFSDYKSYRSAVANPIDPAKLTDEEKEKYLLYVSLLHNNAIVFDPTGVKSLRVYNTGVDNQGRDVVNFIAGKTLVTQPAEFLKGADVTSAYNLAQSGGVGSSTTTAGYNFITTDSPLTTVSVPADQAQNHYSPFQVIRAFGGNVVRLHLWVNPAGDYFTVSQTIELIQKAHEQGLKVIIDLMLSDSWTNPANQTMPDAWRHDYSTWLDGQAVNRSYIGSLATIRELVYNYVHSSLQTMSNANAIPDYVQIGNETSSRILMPKKFTDYRATDSNDKEDIARYLGRQPSEINDLSQLYTINWDWNATLVNEALRAVSQFSRSDGSRIQTIFHMPFYYSMYWWIDQATNANAPGRVGTTVVDDFDFIGTSFYLANTGGRSPSISDLRKEIQKIGRDFGKKVLILETAFPRTWTDADAQGNVWSPSNASGPGDWGIGAGTPTDADQRQWLINLRDNLRQEPSAAGFLLWEPFWKGDKPGIWPDGSAWDNMGFLDTTGKLVVDGGVQVLCEQGCPSPDTDFADKINRIYKVDGTNYDIFPLKNGVRFGTDFIIRNYSKNTQAYLTGIFNKDIFQFLELRPKSTSTSDFYFVATQNMIDNIMLGVNILTDNISWRQGSQSQVLDNEVDLTEDSIFLATSGNVTYAYNLYRIVKMHASTSTGDVLIYLNAYDRADIRTDEAVSAIEGPFLISSTEPEIKIYTASDCVGCAQLSRGPNTTSPYLAAGNGGDHLTKPQNSSGAIKLAYSASADAVVSVRVRKTNDDYLVAYSLPYPIGGTDYGTETIGSLSTEDVAPALQGPYEFWLDHLRNINSSIATKSIYKIEGVNYGASSRNVPGDFRNANLRDVSGKVVNDPDTGMPFKLQLLDSILKYAFTNDKLLLIDGAIENTNAFFAYYSMMATNTRDQVAFVGPSGLTMDSLVAMYGKSFMKQIQYIPSFDPEDWAIDARQSYPWVSYLSFKQEAEEGNCRVPGYILNFKNNIATRSSNQMDLIAATESATKWIGGYNWQPTCCNTYQYTLLRTDCDHPESGCLNFDLRGDLDFLTAKGLNFFITDNIEGTVNYINARRQP